MSADESRSGTPKQLAATKRRRLSRGSWLGGFVVLGLWVLVAVPGLPREEDVASSWSEKFLMTRDFGWPTVHCTTFEWDFRERESGFWSNPSNWIYWSTNVATHFRWLGVIVNLSVLTGTILVVVGLIEFRIRKRGGLFQFRLWELMVAFAFVAVVVRQVDSALKESARDHQSEQEFSLLVKNPGHKRFDLDYGRLDWQYSFPIVFRRILDYRQSIVLPWSSEPISFFRVEEVILISGLDLKEGPDRNKMIQCLEQFNAGKPVHFVIDNNADWLLDAVKNARHLELTRTQVEKDFDWLRDFRNLESFDFDGRASGSLEKLLKEIPHPEKLVSLSVRSNLKVDKDTDLGRFTKLKILKLTLSPEEKRILSRNHPRFATIVQDYE